MIRPVIAGAALACLSATLVATGCGSSSPGPPRAAPVTHRVEMKGFAFEPRDLTVAAGDSVVWTNRDFVPHTVTDDAGRWDSGSVAPDSSWRTVVKAGGGYHCTLHPSMKGGLSIR